MQLLADRIAGKAEAKARGRGLCRRLADLDQRRSPSLGLPACERRDQAGCVLSWQSFGEPPIRS
jgi:hypothetical protein